MDVLSVRDLIADARLAGLSVEAVDGRLEVRARVRTDEAAAFAARLGAAKDEVLALLTPPPIVDTPWAWRSHDFWWPGGDTPEDIAELHPQARADLLAVSAIRGEKTG